MRMERQQSRSASFKSAPSSSSVIGHTPNGLQKLEIAPAVNTATALSLVHTQTIMGFDFQPIEVTSPALAYLLLGGFVVFFSMISLLAKQRLYIGEAILATAFGIIIGPHGANIMDPRSWGHNSLSNNSITLEVMRVTLATGLFAIGVELPKAYLAKHARSLAIMVVPTMAFGWVVSAGFIFWLFPGLNFISSLCISACLTPTDPILAVAITSGTFAIKHVPGNIRRLIAAESAANDGLAYPFLSISIYLTIESSKRRAIGEWILVGWLYQVILGIFIGACLGLCFSHLMKFARRRGFIDRESYVAQYIAMSLLTIGLTNLLGSDDLLAAFAAGSAISWDGDFNVVTEGEAFATVLDLIINCAAFIYIGAWLPFQSYNIPELNIVPWRLTVLLILILVFRRLPSLLLLYKLVPEIDNWREAVFTGHFGPMGVGAIFISTLALTRLVEPNIPPHNQEERLAASLHPIVSFVVLGSIIVHGLSIPFFKIGHRTVSLSSTWSKPSTTTDWLFLTKSVPKNEGLTDTDRTEVQLAVENGTAAGGERMEESRQNPVLPGPVVEIPMHGIESSSGTPVIGHEEAMIQGSRNPFPEIISKDGPSPTSTVETRPPHSFPIPSLSRDGLATIHEVDVSELRNNDGPKAKTVQFRE